MLGHRLNPTIHRYEDVELIEVHSEHLECSFMVAKDEWETGKKLLNIFSPIDGNVLGFPHYRLHRANISATGPKLPDGTTAQPGMAEAIEIQRQAGHTIYAENLSPCSTELAPTTRVPEMRNTERKLCKSQFGAWQRTTTTAPMPASTKRRAPHTGA